MAARAAVAVNGAAAVVAGIDVVTVVTVATQQPNELYHSPGIDVVTVVTVATQQRHELYHSAAARGLDCDNMLHGSLYNTV